MAVRRDPGAVTRRSALLALSATMVSPGLMAQQTRPVIQTRRLNNVIVAVSNLERSAAFYEKLLGPSVRQDDTVVFRIGEGPHFFALRAVRSGAKPDFLSYGMTVADFDAERTLRTFADLGVGGAQITRRGDTPSCSSQIPMASRFSFSIRPMDMARVPGATRCRRRPRRLRYLRSSQNPSTTSRSPSQTERARKNSIRPCSACRFARCRERRHLAIGEGTDGIVFNPTTNNPNAISGINHARFTIENFDAERVMATLTDIGLEPIETGIPALLKPLTCRVRWRQRANNGGGPTSPLGTPEVYFTDPDNIRHQIQDVSYCGGSGRLGQICP